jgi:hypothetical protein
MSSKYDMEDGKDDIKSEEIDGRPVHMPPRGRHSTVIRAFLGTPYSARHLSVMRQFFLAAAFAVSASPALALCYSPAVGDVPTQLAAQTAQLLCEHDELKAMGDAQFRQLQLEGQLKQQQILLEEQLRFEQQMAALSASINP